MVAKSKAVEAALAEGELPEGVVVGETVAALPRVKHIMRYFAGAGVPPDKTKGIYSGEEIDEYLSFWDASGYDLTASHYLGEQVVDVETNMKAFGFMYVLKLKE